MSIPNMIDVVASMRDRHPEAWRNAHTGNAHTEDFIRLLAWELYSQHDQNWGLNGKRGDPNVLSQDVIAWKGEGMQSDAQAGRRIQLFDVIGGAGGPDPKPVWGAIDDPTPGAWVQPAAIDGAGGGVVPGGGGNTGGTKPVPVLACRMSDDALQVLASLAATLQRIEAQVANLDARLNEQRIAEIWDNASVARQKAEYAVTAIQEVEKKGFTAPTYVLQNRILGTITLKPQQ